MRRQSTEVPVERFSVYSPRHPKIKELVPEYVPFTSDDVFALHDCLNELGTFNIPLITSAVSDDSGITATNIEAFKPTLQAKAVSQGIEESASETTYCPTFASTASDPDTALLLTRAAETETFPMGTHWWLRDHVQIAYSLIKAGSRLMNEEYKDQGKQMLLSALSIMSTPAQLTRMSYCIEGDTLDSYEDDWESHGAVPQVFLNRNNLDGLETENWSHKQDAIPMLAWTTLDALENGNLTLKDLTPDHLTFLTGIVPYMINRRFWDEANSGSWEEIATVRSSTLAWQLATLDRISRLRDNQKLYPLWELMNMRYEREKSQMNFSHGELSVQDTMDYVVRACVSRVSRILFDTLTFEDVVEAGREEQRYDPVGRRHVDAALILPLQIGVYEIIAREIGAHPDFGKLQEQFAIESIVRGLETPYGMKRYESDTYQGYNYFGGAVSDALKTMYGTAPSGDASGMHVFLGRKGIVEEQDEVAEASWQHPVWQLVEYYANKMRSARYDEDINNYRSRMEHFLRLGCSKITGENERTLAYVNGQSVVTAVPAGRIPEAYVSLTMLGSRRVAPSPHTPLNWATATALSAFTAVEEALQHIEETCE